MFIYLFRRIMYLIPIIICVNLGTFALFFMVNTPDDMARMHLGYKHVTPEAILRWKQSQGLDKPLFFNPKSSGIEKLTQTVFFTKTVSLMTFHFGLSQNNRNISQDIKERMWPSLALAIPTFLLSLWINITVALLMAFFRNTYIDKISVTLCIIMMSISALFYIIVGQFIVGKLLNLVPISGYVGGLDAIRFLALPVIIGVLISLGAGARWYRILFLEELEKNYIRTARAKGLSEIRILFKHLLRNALIPIVTNVVALIPLLFMGSLLMESFFGIPGLGSYTIDAIQQQDFDIVRVMVFLGTIFYMIGLILTDMAYVLIDPRVKLS